MKSNPAAVFGAEKLVELKHFVDGVHVLSLFNDAKQVLGNFENEADVLSILF